MWVGVLFVKNLTISVFLLGLLIGVVCSLLYLIHSDHFRLSSYVFLATLWIGIIAAHQLFNAPTLLYLMALLMIIATLLTNKYVSLAMIAVSLFYLWTVLAGQDRNLESIVRSPIPYVLASWLLGTIITSRLR